MGMGPHEPCGPPGGLVLRRSLPPTLYRQELPGSEAGGEHHGIDLGVPGPGAGFPVLRVHPEALDLIGERGVLHESVRPPGEVRILTDSLRERPGPRQADGEPEFPEGETVIRGVAERPAPGKGGEAGEGRTTIMPPDRPLPT